MPEVELLNLPTSEPKKMGRPERSMEMQAVLMVCGFVSGCVVVR